MSYESSQARTILERTLKKGVALKTIAERSDVSVRTISRLRNGHTVSVVSALSVMNGLGVIWAERKEANLAATESSMRKPVITHDHASASFEQVEQAALDRGIKADIGLRDTELECAKYRRVMALEAELDAWQLKCGKERDKSEQLQNELRHTETIAQAYSKDLQIMSASWKAVSVERDNLERNLSQRDRQSKSCENALIESHEKCKTQQALIELRDAQIALNKNAALIAEHESKRLIKKAKSQRNACQAVAFLAVVMFLLAVFGGGV